MDKDFIYGYFNLGIVYRRLKAYDLSLKFLNKAKELNPEYYYTYNEMSSVLSLLKRHEEALSIASDLLSRITPDTDLTIKLDAYTNRGNASYYLRKYEDAIKDYTYIIDQLDNRNLSAFVNRGSAYRCLNQFDKAEADLHTATQLKADDGYAYMELAIINEARGNLEEFFRLAEKAVTSPSPYPLKEDLDDEPVFKKYLGDPRFQKLLH